MDAMLQAMQSGPGVVGAKQAGAGFSGCMVAVPDSAHVEDFAAHVSAAYAAATANEPVIDPVRATPGAGIFKMAVQM